LNALSQINNPLTSVDTNLVVIRYRNIIVNYIKEKEIPMDNNKNRMKDRPKSNPELRKMSPKHNADVGIENGQIIGVHEGKHEKSRTNIK
jgi:hypothetical protein